MPKKTYRRFNPNQTYLFDQDPRDWLPDDHLVFFIEDILSEVDYTAFHEAHEDEQRGHPPYDPRAMVRIIVLGYAVGVRSSRKLAKACVENVAFRLIADGNQPKKSAICDFHNRHREALQDLLTQVTQLALSMGMATVSEVFVDGSKLHANASLEANMTYEELVAEEEAITASIAAWFDAVDEADDEDEEATAGSTPEDRVPPGLEGREERLERIREAREKLEELGRQQAREQEEKREAHEARQPHPGRPPNEPDPHPPDVKRNTTDPDSRIMWRRGQHLQGYNAQAAVSRSGLVLGGDVTLEENDQHQLNPMIEVVEGATGASPETVVADAGYWNEEEIQEVPEDVEVVVVPPDKPGDQDVDPSPGKDAGEPGGGEEAEGSLWERFRARARTAEARALQRVRSCVVEPVFGDVRVNKGLDGFLRRGLPGVRVEWALGLVGVNLVRMAGRMRG